MGRQRAASSRYVLIVEKMHSEPQPSSSIISCIVLEKACVHQANALSM